MKIWDKYNKKIKKILPSFQSNISHNKSFQNIKKIIPCIENHIITKNIVKSVKKKVQFLEKYHIKKTFYKYLNFMVKRIKITELIFYKFKESRKNEFYSRFKSNTTEENTEVIPLQKNKDQKDKNNRVHTKKIRK